MCHSYSLFGTKTARTCDPESRLSGLIRGAAIDEPRGGFCGRGFDTIGVSRRYAIRWRSLPYAYPGTLLDPVPGYGP